MLREDSYYCYVIVMQLFEATKTFMKTIAKLVMRDSGSSMTDAEMNTKAEEFAQDVFDFELQLANVSITVMSAWQTGRAGLVPLIKYKYVLQ